MTKAVGVWIDHRKAVIALVAHGAEETQEIRSGVEKHPGRRASASSTRRHESQRAKADDIREREFTGQLNVYYDEVIAAIRGAEAILIFGPGEAKGELQRRLERDGPDKRIVAVEAVDKMTDRQIVAKVREYFEK